MRAEAIWLLIHGILQFPTLYPLMNQHTFAIALTLTRLHSALSHTRAYIRSHRRNVIKINVYVDVFTNNVINFFIQKKVLTILFSNGINGGKRGKIQ